MKEENIQQKENTILLEFGEKAEIEWLRTHNDRDYSVKASYVQNIIAQIQFLNRQVDNIYTFVNERCVKK